MRLLTSLFQDNRPLKWGNVCGCHVLIIIISSYSHVVDSPPLRGQAVEWGKEHCIIKFQDTAGTY